MTNRITGTNSGIDVDSVVKQSLSTQQNKIDKAYQQQKVYEYQQAQLKEIVNDVSKFYDKYLDILSGDSLLKGTAFETASFTTTDLTGATSTAVTAKGFAGADVTDYKVIVTQLASKATSNTLTSNNLSVGKTIKIETESGEVEFTVSSKKDGSDEVDLEKTAKELNSKLKSAGINVTAKYSQFTGGITLESGEMGESASFTYQIDGGEKITATGKDAKATISKGDDSIDISSKSNIVTVDNVQFTFNAVTSVNSDDSKPVDHLDYTDTTKNKVTISKDDVTTIREGTTVKTTKAYSDTISVNITGTDEITVSGHLTALSKDGNTVSEDGNKITSKDGKTTTTTTKNEDGTTIIKTVKEYEDGTVVTTELTQKDGEKDQIKSTATIGTGDGKLTHLEGDDKSAVVSITSKNGAKNTIIQNGITTTTEKQSDGTIKKTVTDGSVSNTSTFGEVNLSGKTDISGLKDTIVGFVNDYNKVMETINEKLWETRDKDYMPLTEEQKKEMSESEIEAWEKKAQTGLLRNDSDLRRIQSAMKSAMSSMMSSTGLTLESIGIEPVDNYTTKNGMYKIDEDKLTKALQNNSEDVKDLFTRSAGTEKDSNGNIIDKGGVLTQLQSVLKNEFKASTSSLSKRIGFDGTSTENSNTLSKNITKQKSLITQLKEKYSNKETALYKKYSNLEVMLEKLNSQSNSLYAMLGIS
ncbi:flagellar filament capping protein FliD [Clostridium sp. LQ25]|uniref:flagellar filament capping protein FliD n=1 Tax=Clostridium sp. LQ25 TaxID=2992805 RepID=UPI0022519A4E|nr:flagellar filament capping protein FliD [Clostridium sp. LQ25]UZT06956.1 flagellar filament capping protein FliD [Clostridium sp. LQ25]